jgi:hypothetical protein
MEMASYQETGSYLPFRRIVLHIVHVGDGFLSVLISSRDTYVCSVAHSVSDIVYFLGDSLLFALLFLYDWLFIEFARTLSWN